MRVFTYVAIARAHGIVLSSGRLFCARAAVAQKNRTAPPRDSALHIISYYTFYVITRGACACAQEMAATNLASFYFLLFFCPRPPPHDRWRSPANRETRPFRSCIAHARARSTRMCNGPLTRPMY
jgi:hypothetical protein